MSRSLLDATQGEMLRACFLYNWPGGKGKPASPSIEANYRRGLTEAAKLLGGPMPPYDSEYPVRIQDHDWDCFEESANWALHALGRNPSDAWLERQMLADGIESKELGLLDGSGKQAAAWITSQYSDPSEGTPTITAQNASPVNFDDVRSVAGTTAVLIGGHRWGSAGHWTGVRRYDRSADVLVLANPGGNGPVYGLTTMDRQQFAARGPWSMVVLRAGGSTPVPNPPADTRIERAKAKLVEALAVLEERS